MTNASYRTPAAGSSPSVPVSAPVADGSPVRMHCMDEPWRVYDELLLAILKTPDILARDGIVVMALEVGQTCREPQYAHMDWFPGTSTMSRPETIGALRGMTLVAQMLPPAAFRTQHHILGSVAGGHDDLSSPGAVAEQIHLIAQQVTAVVNLQHLTRQVTTFHRSWHQLQGGTFELPPPTMTIDEQGRLKTASVLPLYGSWDFVGERSPSPDVLSGGVVRGLPGATVIPMPGVTSHAFPRASSSPPARLPGQAGPDASAGFPAGFPRPGHFR